MMLSNRDRMNFTPASLPRLMACVMMVCLPCGCGEAPSAPAGAESGGVSEKDSSMTANENVASPEAGEPVTEPAVEGKVLRHAVFFSFKDESTAEDIERVVNAFRELPSKIDEIIDFEWGVNNSPEGLDDGFTHCFLLTFKDEAGRAAYLPHPDHKAFGDVLRGHNDAVFVIDYWGDAQEPVAEALRHAVFFRFKPDASPEDIAKVEDAFAELPSKIDVIRQFEWGTNNSPEKHDAGFTHCFMVTFDSEEGRAAYLPHPEHLAFVEILKPILDAPRVLDYRAQK